MRLDVPVLLTLAIGAAALQTVLPPPAWMAMKPPLLTAVAAYYALSRELPLALTAALWCGALADLAGGFPLLVTCCFNLALCAGLRALRRYADAIFYWRGLITMAAASLLQAVWYAMAAGRGVLTAGAFFHALPGTALGGAAAGWAMFMVCGWLDGLAGNVKGAAPEDEASWHSANL